MKTGNVKKVAALDKVLQICNAQGTSYNPSKASIQPTALRSLLELAQEKQKAVIVTRSAYALAVNTRKQSFAGIPKLATQIVHMVSALGASSSDCADARLIQRKLYAARKKAKNIGPVTQTEGGQSPKGLRFISRLDRDNMMNTFESLIQIVEGMRGYNPNEPEFKIEMLRSTLARLRSENMATTLAAIDYSNARISRNLTLYGPEGVVESTNAAKDYIRAKFGIYSMQALQTKSSMNF